VKRPKQSRLAPLAAALFVIVAASLACGPAATAAATATVTAPPPATPTSARAAATNPPPPTDKPTQAELPAATLVASGGNLNMRRGPGVGYNILAVLRSGDQGTITARSEDGEWFYMEIPGQPGSSAWVSGVSQYSSIQGDPSGAPVLIVEPPVPAYIRNCIFHPVKILPGDMVLPNQTAAPDNKVRFNPGIYEGYDQNVEGYPKIFSIELREGKTADITSDGLNNIYSCP
jgi:hypothetical protein